MDVSRVHFVKQDAKDTTLSENFRSLFLELSYN